MCICCGAWIVQCATDFVVYTSKGLWLLAKMGFTATKMVPGRLIIKMCICCGAWIVQCATCFVVYTGMGLWLLAKMGYTATRVVAGSLIIKMGNCCGDCKVLCVVYTGMGLLGLITMMGATGSLIMGKGCAALIVQCVAGIVVNTGKGLWLLPKLGFSKTGVVAGSLAATAMSFFGNVVTGCVIAMATSMGMKI